MGEDWSLSKFSASILGSEETSSLNGCHVATMLTDEHLVCICASTLFASPTVGIEGCIQDAGHGTKEQKDDEDDQVECVFELFAISSVSAVCTCSFDHLESLHASTGLLLYLTVNIFEEWRKAGYWRGSSIFSAGRAIECEGRGMFLCLTQSEVSYTPCIELRTKAHGTGLFSAEAPESMIPMNEEVFAKEVHQFHMKHFLKHCLVGSDGHLRKALPRVLEEVFRK